MAADKRQGKRESRKFYISVEGVNCERLYFEHLKKLINSSGRNVYNLSVTPRVASPMDFAKRNAHNKRIPFIHIQDIEDYNDETQRNKFYNLIKELREAEELLGVEYYLGYQEHFEHADRIHRWPSYRRVIWGKNFIDEIEIDYTANFSKQVFLGNHRFHINDQHPDLSALPPHHRYHLISILP